MKRQPRQLPIPPAIPTVDEQVRLLFGVARNVLTARYQSDIHPINEGRYPGPLQDLDDSYRRVLEDLNDVAHGGTAYES